MAQELTIDESIDIESLLEQMTPAKWREFFAWWQAKNSQDCNETIAKMRAIAGRHLEGVELVVER